MTSVVPQYTYLDPVQPLQNWLKLTSVQPFAGLVAAPSSLARVFATEQGGLIPGGADFPAVGFHLTPATTFDNTLLLAALQFDCYGDTTTEAASLAMALATLLASTPPRTRLSSTVVFHGPADNRSVFSLPAKNVKRTPRQILLSQLTFTAF